MNKEDGMEIEKKTQIESAIATVLATIGIYFLTAVDREHIIGAQSFFTLPGAVLLFFFYRKRLQTNHFWKNRRKLVFSAVFSFLFALSFFLGYQMRVSGMTAPGVMGKIGNLVKSAFLSFAFLPFFEALFDWTDQKKNRIDEEKPAEEAKKKFGVKGAFFLSWGIIFLCWIPVFLAYYPGIMSYDSNRQFTESYLGVYWDLQPIFHTFLIRMSLLLGEVLGGYDRGVAVYSIVQMLTLSSAMAYSISFLYELTKKRRYVFLTSLFFGIVPIFSVLALCVTKDIFFSAFFLFFTVFSLKRFLNRNSGKIGYEIGMILTAVMMCLFRKNGIYGIALFALFYVLAMKKERIRALVLSIIILACCFGGRTLIRVVLKGTPGPKIEMYSVPIQQFSRVSFIRRNELSEEEKETMERYIAGCTTVETHNVSLADGPKFVSSTEAWTDTPQMLKDWVHFGTKYPSDYIDAYLGLTAGYWFTDDIAISQYLGYGRDSMRGLIETFNASKPIDEFYEGVPTHSYLPKLQYFLEGIVSDEQYLNWPVVAILFKPAVYCWIMAVLFGVLLYQKRRREFAAASLQITYFCTVILGPVANIRYVFQIMIGLPLLAAFVLSSEKGKNLSDSGNETDVIRSR